MKIRITRTVKVTQEIEFSDPKEYGFETTEEWEAYEQSLKGEDAFEALTQMVSGVDEANIEQGTRTEVIDG